jgi:hypothetical protein
VPALRSVVGKASRPKIRGAVPANEPFRCSVVHRGTHYSRFNIPITFHAELPHVSAYEIRRPVASGCSSYGDQDVRAYLGEALRRLQPGCDKHRGKNAKYRFVLGEQRLV